MPLEIMEKHGSIVCPFYVKSVWALDQYWYPKQFKRWHDILEKDFIENFKWLRLNCTIKEYHMCWNGGLLRKEPNEEVIAEFAKYKGIEDLEIAAKYFNKNCSVCDKKIKTKDDIAMNLKLNGRNTTKYFCKKHLIEHHDITKEKYKEYVEGFKNSDCDLF